MKVAKTVAGLEREIRELEAELIRAGRGHLIEQYRKQYGVKS